MSEPQPKLFPSIPAIGSDKQDGFARILAHKLALSLPALEAVLKTETGRDPLPVFPHYYSKPEAGKIIDHLLAKCKLAGIEIKTHGRRGGAGRRGEKGGENPSPPGGKALKDYSAVELNNELQSRGVRQLAGVESELLLAELNGRGLSTGLKTAHLDAIASELERRGYPGEAMKANPDLLGQAEHLGRLLLRAYAGEEFERWKAEARFALVNSGLLPQ